MSLHNIGSSACARVCGGISEWLEINVGVIQGCVISPWLVGILMDEK